MLAALCTEGAKGMTSGWLLHLAQSLLLTQVESCSSSMREREKESVCCAASQFRRTIDDKCFGFPPTAGELSLSHEHSRTAEGEKIMFLIQIKSLTCCLELHLLSLALLLFARGLWGITASRCCRCLARQQFIITYRCVTLGLLQSIRLLACLFVGLMTTVSELVARLAVQSSRSRETGGSAPRATQPSTARRSCRSLFARVAPCRPRYRWRRSRRRAKSAPCEPAQSGP